MIAVHKACLHWDLKDVRKGVEQSDGVFGGLLIWMVWQ